jgi:hypothetical protein
MPLVDLAEGIIEEGLLGLGRCNAVLQLRLAPIRFVPLEALQTSQDEPHGSRLA